MTVDLVVGTVYQGAISINGIAESITQALATHYDLAVSGITALLGFVYAVFQFGTVVFVTVMWLVLSVLEFLFNCSQTLFSTLLWMAVWLIHFSCGLWSGVGTTIAEYATPWSFSSNATETVLSYKFIVLGLVLCLVTVLVLSVVVLVVVYLCVNTFRRRRNQPRPLVPTHRQRVANREAEGERQRTRVVERRNVHNAAEPDHGRRGRVVYARTDSALRPRSSSSSLRQSSQNVDTHRQITQQRPHTEPRNTDIRNITRTAAGQPSQVSRGSTPSHNHHHHPTPSQDRPTTSQHSSGRRPHSPVRKRLSLAGASGSSHRHSSVESTPKTETVEFKRRLSEVSAELVKEREQKLCVVCMDSVRNVLLRPCNHYCLCECCANTLTRCPVCTKNILRHEKIYFS